MAKQDKTDPFVIVCEKVDRQSAMYGNDPYWKAMKLGCDAVREEKVTDEVVEIVRKEQMSWPGGANREALNLLMDKLQ